jgi:hypothetical protein
VRARFKRTLKAPETNVPMGIQPVRALWNNRLIGKK